MNPTPLRAIRAVIRRHQSAAFVVMAWTLSWLWWLPMALTGAHTRPGLGWPTHLPGLLGPAIAAFAVTAACDGAAGVRDLAARLVRWRAGWPPFALVAGTAALVGLAPLVALARGAELPAAPDYVTYSGIGSLPVLVTVLYALLINGFGEETGWRGFLVERLLPRHGVTRTALLVAPVWALWHLPMFWVVQSFRDLGAGAMVGWVVGLSAGSVLLTWLYLWSGRSILVVALWHTAFNFATATTAANGVPAATASTLVMIAAVAVAVRTRPKRPRPRPPVTRTAEGVGSGA